MAEKRRSLQRIVTQGDESLGRLKAFAERS
jgi:hypothetical protein